MYYIILLTATLIIIGISKIELSRDIKYTKREKVKTIIKIYSEGISNKRR